MQTEPLHTYTTILNVSLQRMSIIGYFLSNYQSRYLKFQILNNVMLSLQLCLFRLELELSLVGALKKKIICKGSGTYSKLNPIEIVLFKRSFYKIGWKLMKFMLLMLKSSLLPNTYSIVTNLSIFHRFENNHLDELMLLTWEMDQ